MKAMILAAGLGTRLKPWTLNHPKALVPVDSVPMLERVIEKLKGEGFDDITVNVHHFSDQIIKFLSDHPFGININISDESTELLDTGGGILKASQYFGDEPVLIHNVDILSDTDLTELMRIHKENENDITLLTSNRESGRKLIFDRDGSLCGWHNLKSGEYKPSGFKENKNYVEEAFSGIYVIGKKAREAMRDFARKKGTEVFPVMDFFLSIPDNVKIGRHKVENPVILDIGKPDTLAKASDLLKLMRTGI